MFKKSKLLLLGVTSLALLVGCGGETNNVNPDDEFEVNDDPTIQGFEMYVIGSHWNNWDPATIKEAEGCAFSRTDEGYLSITLEITEEMVSGWVGFKFISDASWNTQYGVEDLDWEKTSTTLTNQWTKNDGSVKTKYDFVEGTSNRSNVEIKVAGTYTVYYDPANFDSEETDKTTYSNKFWVEVE